MQPPRLRFGVFIAPFHPVDENPSLALARDLELVELPRPARLRRGLDRRAPLRGLRDHRLAGALHRRRRRSARGTSGSAPASSSLPYHHPLMLADRINQLDHMTRGRVMFGVGPGALPSDAFMMGIDPLTQRDMMDEAIDVLVPLLRGETVTREDRLVQAARGAAPAPALHAPARRDLRGLARSRRPARARPASTASACSRSAPPRTGGFNALATNWEICEERAKEFDQSVRRDQWRLVGPDAHRRDPRAGARGREVRAREVALLLPRGRRAAARAERERRRAPSRRCARPASP